MLSGGKVRGKVSSSSKNDALIEIEETQAALRESIRRARELAEQSDRLSAAAATIPKRRRNRDPSPSRARVFPISTC
jgi:hypothetical protein